MAVGAKLYVYLLTEICFGAFNVKYDVFQEDNVIATEEKVYLGSHYIHPYFTAIKIEPTTLNSVGLTRNWSLQQTFEPGYTYLVKTYEEDVYLDEPLHLYRRADGQEKTFFMFIPGILAPGSRIILRFTLVAPWKRLVIAFMCTVGSERAFKMKLVNDDAGPYAEFCYEQNNAERGKEIVSTFPFSTGKEENVSFIVLESSLQIRVGDSLYHTFFPVVSLQTAVSLGIWFETTPDQLYLNRVEMFVSSLNNG